MTRSIVETGGLRFAVRAEDTGVGQALRDWGQFAPVEQQLIAEVCQGDLLDVGANIGAIALPFARANPSRRVTAIEAHPGIYELLAENVAANGLQNVDAVQAAAGEATGFMVVPVADLSIAGNHGASSFYEKGSPTARTRVVRIDDVAPTDCRLVKVDVEGFEDRVLRGAPRLLNEVGPEWLVEVSRHRPNTTAFVRKTLEDAGYRLFWFFSPWRTPVGPGATGDTAVFATRADPPWEMTPVQDGWPSSLDDFPFLKRFAA